MLNCIKCSYSLFLPNHSDCHWAMEGKGNFIAALIQRLNTSIEYCRPKAAKLAGAELPQNYLSTFYLSHSIFCQVKNSVENCQAYDRT